LRGESYGPGDRWRNENHRNAMGKAWENCDLPKKNVDLNGFHGNYSWWKIKLSLTNH
jgi:hypothetical protein